MKTIFTTLIVAICFSLSAQHMHHFHVDFAYKADTADFMAGQTYADANGRNFNMTAANFYASNFKLLKSDTTEITFDEYLLIRNDDQGTYDNENMLGMVGHDTYIGLRFDVGIADSLTNHGDPTTYAAGDALSIQTPSMHWSWNSGYIFSRFEGVFDSTSAGTNTPNKSFNYHIGTLNMVRTVELFFSNPIEMTHSDGMLMVNLELDILGYLNNVDLLTENKTHTMDNMPLAMKIANNLQGAFSAMAMKMPGTTGISDIADINGSLFPNPATNQATLQFNNPGEVFELKVVDLTGRVVLEQSNITDNRVDINTAELSGGIYLLRLNSASGVYSTRLLVQ